LDIPEERCAARGAQSPVGQRGAATIANVPSNCNVESVSKYAPHSETVRIPPLPLWLVPESIRYHCAQGFRLSRGGDPCATVSELCQNRIWSGRLACSSSKRRLPKSLEILEDVQRNERFGPYDSSLGAGTRRLNSDRHGQARIGILGLAPGPNREPQFPESAALDRDCPLRSFF